MAAAGQQFQHLDAAAQAPDLRLRSFSIKLRDQCGERAGCVAAGRGLPSNCNRDIRGRCGENARAGAVGHENRQHRMHERVAPRDPAGDGGLGVGGRERILVGGSLPQLRGETPGEFLGTPQQPQPHLPADQRDRQRPTDGTIRPRGRGCLHREINAGVRILSTQRFEQQVASRPNPLQFAIRVRASRDVLVPCGSSVDRGLELIHGDEYRRPIKCRSFRRDNSLFSRLPCHRPLLAHPP